MNKYDAYRTDFAALTGQQGPRLWRSLEELADTPEMRRFIEAEFPYINEARTDRRTLLRLMGASLAMAGLTACGDPTVAPLYSQPRGNWADALGQASTFASLLDLDGYGRGVLVETRNGRPVKIEGNPLHPASLGATDVFAQAELLSLYDPDRSQGAFYNGKDVDDRAAPRVLAEARAAFAPGGEGVRILTGPVTSPTLRALISAMQREYPAARAHEYSPIADDNSRAGAVLAFGRPVQAVHDFSRADVILTLGADPFGDMEGHVRHARDFADRRRAAHSGGMLPRLYAAESTPSLSGARADHRAVLRPAEIGFFARAVASRLGVVQDGPSDVHPMVETAAADLSRAGSNALVVVGREQPAALHALAYAINAALGASGTTSRYIEPLTAAETGHMASLAALAEDMAAGAVSQLLIIGGNPAYDAPADLDFADLIRRVPVSIHLGLYRDETAAAARWHLPRKHALESWGDGRAFEGTAGIRQPVATPLFDAFSDEEALALFLGADTHDGNDIVRTYWRDALGAADFEQSWTAILADGVVPNSAAPALDVSLQPDWDQQLPSEALPGLTVLFAPDPSVWDGRYANNGWLQELPRPLTKIVWDNAALIAPATAETLGLKTGDIASFNAGGRSLLAPIRLMPGHALETVTMPLGYGRRAAGRIGAGVGFNAYALRTSHAPWIATGVEVVRTGEAHALVTTQDHHGMEGRDIVRIVAPDQAVETPSTEPQPSFYPDYAYEGHAWGMTIDLDTCLGCNACVIACQAENNVPIVGRDEVARGREMHWLRIDRYHAGDVEDPDTYFQPVPCMHCEKAPCEVVCPVNATVHSSEGLNEMVYNRCIGTRTCSNNCPYKVRRFNWFDYSPPDPEPRNPDVSVRPRGVMEKCTYCVQRISAARIDAKLEGRRIGEELMTACQQACPTRAITFGDINDPASAVSRLKASPRNYALLGELDTRPRTTYLARVANPADPEGSG